MNGKWNKVEQVAAVEPDLVFGQCTGVPKKEGAGEIPEGCEVVEDDGQPEGGTLFVQEVLVQGEYGDDDQDEGKEDGRSIHLPVVDGYEGGKNDA